MILFWSVVAVLTAFVLVLLIAPLVRRGRVRAAPRTEYDVAVFRDQLREVEKDLERGLLDETQAEAVRTEVKRRLLAAAGEDREEAAHMPGGTVSSNLGLVLLLAVLVPAGALGLYRYVGAPGTPDMPLVSRTDPAIQKVRDQAEVSRLVGQLEQKLKRVPGDKKGWQLLANAYQALDRFADAAQALNRVVELSDRDADSLSAYGEGLTMANKFTVTPIAKAVFEEALRKDPNDPRAAYYLGLGAAQTGNVKTAHEIWSGLAARSAPDDPWMGVLQEQLTRAARQLGVAPPKMAAPIAPGPSRADREAARDMSDADRNAMIRSMVQRLADRLAENPDDREGWLRLARAYDVLGEKEKAADARKQAENLARAFSD